MAKDNEPIKYQPRDQDTKDLAQRVDLRYQSKPSQFQVWLRRLLWLVPAICLAASIPFLTGIGATRTAFTNGPMSRVHASFEKRCENCHAPGVTHVRDLECRSCHDGAVHNDRVTETILCADCHTEHRGNRQLTEMSDIQCARCHADLPAHRKSGELAASIAGFKGPRKGLFGFAKPATHIDWLPNMTPDGRPLKLNHAVHMPRESRTIKGMTLPMKCTDCHQLNPNGAVGEVMPVTFEKHCRRCHSEELVFDRFGIVKTGAEPAPHAKNPNATRSQIQQTIERAMSSEPDIWQKVFLGRDVKASSGPAFLAMASKASEDYLFNEPKRGCQKCHEYEAVQADGLPVVKKVQAINGRFVAGEKDGVPWLKRAMFSHRAHRAESCESCHSQARASEKSSDILVPGMQSCTPCHGASNSALDNCTQCHQYHDHTRDKESIGRPVDQLVNKSSGVF
jgi:hypothetical protein